MQRVARAVCCLAWVDFTSTAARRDVGVLLCLVGLAFKCSTWQGRRADLLGLIRPQMLRLVMTACFFDEGTCTQMQVQHAALASKGGVLTCLGGLDLFRGES